MKKTILYLLVSVCLPTYAQKKKTKAAKPVTVLDYFVRTDTSHSEYLSDGNLADYQIVPDAARSTFTEKIQWSDCCEGGLYESPNKHFRYDRATNKLILFQEDIGMKVIRASKVKKERNQSVSSTQEPPKPKSYAYIPSPPSKYVYTNKNVVLLVPPPNQKVTVQAYTQDYQVIYSQWLNGKVKDVDTSSSLEQEVGDYFINKNTNSLEFLCLEGEISQAECEKRKQNLAEKNKQDSVSVRYIIQKTPLTRTFYWSETNIMGDTKISRKCIVVKEKYASVVKTNYYAYQLGLVRTTRIDTRMEQEESKTFSMSFTPAINLDEED